MIRYIAVEKAAANEIISRRQLQSIEFDSGRLLSNFLQEPAVEATLDQSIHVVKYPDGLFFVSPSAFSSDFVVFDLEKSGLFCKRQSDADSLLSFQKVLRFAVKAWANMKLSATEQHVQNTSKVIVWPYPISQRTSFRISIETSPDKTRQEKRSPSGGRCFLVYRSGMDDGRGPNEEADIATFRKFWDDRRSLQIPTRGSVRPLPQINALSVTALDESLDNKFQPYLEYEAWLPLLTNKQRSFVLSGLAAPHRIEGPAGTGKTISLVLKAIAGIKTAREKDEDHRAIFITHSEATRRTVEQLIIVNEASVLTSEQTLKQRQGLAITTLQQLCGDILERKISDSEFIDRDAMESKQMQALYVNDALNAVMEQDYATYQNLLSAGFRAFMESTERWSIAEMVQHEISVVIKGRAEEKLEHYRRLPKLPYGLPVETDSDRGLVWLVFRRYQSELQISAQFDTDDIVLTAIGQLDTPIWRRRRANEGYDGIYIDETHLFNVNELSLFHHLSRSSAQFPIAYSVDRSQAIGDRDWSDDLFEATLSPDADTRKETSKTRIESIFRCSPEIVNLAFSVTSSGATLFTNFDDPMSSAVSMFTGEEERKCATPSATVCGNDEEMITSGFEMAESLPKEIHASRSDIAIIAFSDALFADAEEYCMRHNKAVEILKQRGDIEAVQRAEKAGRLILSTPEYVGGLEFDAVVLLGVDAGRVPPTKTLDISDSSNFLTYAAHNRLYVSITRAKYRVEVFATKDRGLSPLLQNAVASDALQMRPC
jgi:superfamily I DNA/RNA helicase